MGAWRTTGLHVFSGAAATLIVVVALAAVALVGCGNDSGTMKASPSATTAASAFGSFKFTDEDHDYMNGMAPILGDVLRAYWDYYELPDGEWSSKDHQTYEAVMSTFAGAYSRWQALEPPSAHLDRVYSLQGEFLGHYAEAAEHMRHVYEYGDDASIQAGDRALLAAQEAWSASSRAMFSAVFGINIDPDVEFTPQEEAYYKDLTTAMTQMSDPWYAIMIDDDASGAQVDEAFASFRTAYEAWGTRTAPTSRFESVHGPWVEALRLSDMAADAYFAGQGIDDASAMEEAKALMSQADGQIEKTLAALGTLLGNEQ